MVDNECLIPNEKFEKYYPGTVIDKETIEPDFSDSVDVVHTVVNQILGFELLSKIYYKLC